MTLRKLYLGRGRAKTEAGNAVSQGGGGDTKFKKQMLVLYFEKEKHPLDIILNC